MFGPHLYAVFGSPIVHSKSPEVHRAFARQTEQDMMYTKQEVTPEEFKETVDDFFELGGMGLNITLPLKELAYKYADKVSLRAKLAKAVNTLIRDKNGSILGDNTDGVGIVRDITINQRWHLKSQRVLILGAGGAVRGVLGPILDEEPKSIVIANRTASKAVDLAKSFEGMGDVSGCGLNSIPPGVFDVIINGTSMSLQGAAPPLNPAQMTAQTCAYDMAYGSGPTAFLQWAESQGLVALADGLGMLVEQAAESFYLWRRVRPKTAPVIQMLREGMEVNP
ncbi:shikimate dehydrogenase [Aurantivibrio plasticivorans]